MSISLNIDKYGGKSVLPVTCGSSRGTAFYIGEGRFLTAWHVVADAVSLNEPIKLTFDGDVLFCNLEKLDDMDAALLIYRDRLLNITPIELLKIDFREDELEIVGYPQELGNGTDYFGVCVKNLKALSDHSRGFDVMVQRTDSFGFHSYSGFSGSPVLNKKGVAVGIVTDQMFNTLGYTSILSISNQLSGKQIKFLDCSDRYDLRPFGIGRCEELAEQSCEKMKSRYSKENHVGDKELETRLQIFCGYGVDRWVGKYREELSQWYNDAGISIRAEVDKLDRLKSSMTGGDIDLETVRHLEILLNKRKNERADYYFVTGNIRNRLMEISDLMGKARDAQILHDKRFLYIHGDAGNGKTQHMCHFTRNISQFRNVYLLFGTEFEDNKTPVQTIQEILGWDGANVLGELNDEMSKRGRYATFIVDALNEGEGTFMWHKLLPVLKEEIDKYSRLKLIVTVRTMESGDKLNDYFHEGWEEIEINGFSDLHEAIEQFFKNSAIHEKADDYLFIKEFQHPLFLKMFCQVYHRLPEECRKAPDILLLYNLYYQSRNKEVSHLVDEDPERMVTSMIMKKLGELSWKQSHCCDVRRVDAINVANELCPNRLWSQNLYHALLKTNLVMEYTHHSGLKTAFQYDSMGDYTRAWWLLSEEKDEEKLLELLVTLVESVQKQITTYNEGICIRQTIKAFLSVWNPAEAIWRKDAFRNGVLTQLLLESLELRNLKTTRSTLPQDLVSSIVLEKDDYIKPDYLLNNFTLYRDYLMEPVHNKLLAMDLVKRDEIWTIPVNRMYDDSSYFYKIRKPIEPNMENARAYLRILCWMMTASHPQLRNTIRRIALEWLRDFSQLCKELITKFYTCSDPYVLRGVYSAVYGVLLLKRDNALAHEVAETVFNNLYGKDKLIPFDIEVRSWTLKILEVNHQCNPGDSFWRDATPPYQRTDNMMEIPDGESFEDEAYFGEGQGAKKMYHSLFSGDFNRYIIGLNSRNESLTYFRDEKPVRLKDITNAVAYRIKHAYGYSNLLSDYDEGMRRDGRLIRRAERIGKKYQWIALAEVKAYLSDTCKMRKDRWSGVNFEKIPYPWYDSDTVSFEPTLTLKGNRSYLDQELFEEVEGENLMVGDARMWIKSQTFVPSPCIIVEDKKGNEWVNIVGYQKKQEENDDKRESFVYICPCLVKMNDADKFEKWAKDTCFYGRWMPEDSGHYEFFWNEYPWSDSYKSMGLEEELDVYARDTSAPCKVVLPYVSQLQEHYECIDDAEEFEGMVNMPSADMFEYLNLHTAERGVTRDENENVVALNRNLQNDILDTMVMRRDLLDKYLEAREYVLFYCMLAEKTLSKELLPFFTQRFSCCMKYVPHGSPIVVQPMTDEKVFFSHNESQDNEMAIDGTDSEI